MISDNTNEVYYGMTTKRLSTRKAGLLNDYKMYVAGKKKFRVEFDLIKQGKINLILIECFPCNNVDEVNARLYSHVIANECINRRKCEKPKEEEKFLDRVETRDRDV